MSEEHYCGLEPPSAKRSCLDMATPSGSATRQRSYPRMVGDNRIVFSGEEADFDHVLALIVSQNCTNHGAEPAEGEMKLTFRGCVALPNADAVTVNLRPAYFLVQGNDAGVHCTAPETTALVKAEQLLNHLLKMFKLPNTMPEFSPEVRSGGSGESDSGDEDVPVDKEIPNVFSDIDKGVVQLVSDSVWRYYKRPLESSFSNGPGKFMSHLGTLLAQCIRGNRYESSHTTKAGGNGPAGVKDMQAGSTIVKYVMIKRTTRNSSGQEESLSSGKRRFSDVSTYDHTKEMYVVAGELTSEGDKAYSQNLEQMLGLWRARQRFMLGWTINPVNVFIRVLVREGDDLTLYNISLPNTFGSFLLLAKLYLAVFLIVDT